MGELVVGVAVGIGAGALGAWIGLRARAAQVRAVQRQRDDAWQRIDAIDLKPQPKGQR